MSCSFRHLTSQTLYSCSGTTAAVPLLHNTEVELRADSVKKVPCVVPESTSYSSFVHSNLDVNLSQDVGQESHFLQIHGKVSHLPIRPLIEPSLKVYLSGHQSSQAITLEITIRVDH